MQVKPVEVVTHAANLTICSLLLGTSVYVIGALLIGLFLACL